MSDEEWDDFKREVVEQRGALETTELSRRLRARRLAARKATHLVDDDDLPVELLALDEAGEPFDARLIVWLPSSSPGVVGVREYDDHERDRKTWTAAVWLHRWQALHRDDWKSDRALIAPRGEAMTMLPVLPRFTERRFERQVVQYAELMGWHVWR